MQSLVIHIQQLKGGECKSATSPEVQNAPHSPQTITVIVSSSVLMISVILIILIERSSKSNREVSRTKVLC